MDYSKKENWSVASERLELLPSRVWTSSYYMHEIYEPILIQFGERSIETDNVVFLEYDILYNQSKIGIISAEFASKNKMFFFTRICIDEAFRRKGFAAEAITALEKRAIVFGAEKFLVYNVKAMDSKTPKIAPMTFWEKLGYEIREVNSDT